MMKSAMIGVILSLGLTMSISNAQPISILGDDEAFLLVKGQKAECMGVGPMECLQVKNNFDQPEWENFYANIQGFEFTEGETTLLKVKKTNIDNPPADAPSIRYELVETVAVMPSLPVVKKVVPVENPK